MIVHTARKLLTRERYKYLSSAAKALGIRFFVQQSESSSSQSSSTAYTYILASALTVTGVISLSCEAAVPASGPIGASSLTLQEPVRQPRNVMLHRMRSAAGRGLNDKYNVDWTTVLGGKDWMDCDRLAPHAFLRSAHQSAYRGRLWVGSSSSVGDHGRKGGVEKNLKTIYEFLLV